jgi:hypothetical protein
MNVSAERLLSFIVIIALLSIFGIAKEPTYPIGISENGRYFVDGNGIPFFWIGTTQWQIFREYTLEEARLTIERIEANGFVFIQTMLLGVGDGTKPNVYGAVPWINNDPLMPNEAYFKNVDSVIQIARENGIIFSITLYHQRYRNYITRENARFWARWLAHRYRNVPNIVWSMTPEAKEEFVPILRALATGLREGDEGYHLITFKPDPAPFSSSFVHGEDWLDFNSMQTWNSVKLIYPMVSHDYGLEPSKPVLMAEGAYEEGSEYGFNVTPLWIRRQAYYSYLAGGHHTYGHNDSWRVLPTWKKSLDAPGAVQIGILKKIFLGLDEWWNLIPDQSVFSSGGTTAGKLLKLAARHQNGKWAIAYLSTNCSFSINLDKLTTTKKIDAVFIDPRTGDRREAGSFTDHGVHRFSTPEEWEDTLLLLSPQNSF